MRGDSGVAGEGRVVGVPKFHSWGRCTMPLTNIGCPTLPLACVLYYIEQSNRTPRCSRKVSAAGLPWLKHLKFSAIHRLNHC